MTHDTTTPTPPEAPAAGGATLLELHRRLVAIHYGLATAGPDDIDRDRRALERLDDALRFISEHPDYRAAREAVEPARRAAIRARREQAASTG